MPEILDLNSLKVELRPQTGLQQTELGVVEIDHGQMWVQVNDKQVALYCGRANQANRALCFIEPFPLVLQQAIANKVAALTGGVAKFSAPPPEEHEPHDDHE